MRERGVRGEGDRQASGRALRRIEVERVVLLGEEREEVGRAWAHLLACVKLGLGLGLSEAAPPSRATMGSRGGRGGGRHGQPRRA